VSHAFRGPAWLSKTTDGGKTWSTAREIFDPGQNSQTIGNVIVVDPASGKLYDFFDEISTNWEPAIHASRAERRFRYLDRRRRHLVEPVGRLCAAGGRRC
jgi:hypothetical protein